MESKNDLLQDDDLQREGLYLSEKGMQHFAELLKWSRFLGIAGMIITSILFVMVLIFGGRIESALNSGYTTSAAEGLLGLLILASISIGYFIISYFLFQFASLGQTSLQSLDQFEFTRAVKNLKKMYLLIAITLSLYLLYSILQTLITQGFLN